MKTAEVKETVLKALAHERCGIQVYQTALDCTLNRDLKHEWQKYLEETKSHVAALEGACESLKIDKAEQTPGVKIVQMMGLGLVDVMRKAQAGGNKIEAELVAADCVVLAETQDHANWDLIGRIADATSGDVATALKQAYDAVEDQEDEHFYHSKGWARELHLKALGLPAILPPPEEKKHVRGVMAAEQAIRQGDESRPSH